MLVKFVSTGGTVYWLRPKSVALVEHGTFENETKVTLTSGRVLDIGVDLPYVIAKLNGTEPPPLED